MKYVWKLYKSSSGFQNKTFILFNLYWLRNIWEKFESDLSINEDSSYRQLGVRKDVSWRLSGIF